MGNENDEDERQLQKGAQGEQAKGLQALDSNAEERELDPRKVQQAMETLLKNSQANKEAQMQRERELAAVKISKPDIATICSEFDLDEKTADRMLREHQGSLSATLETLLHRDATAIQRAPPSRDVKRIYV